MSDFHSDFCRCSIIDLLMQHKFEDLNLINRRWRARENESSNTHIPYLTSMISLPICVFLETLPGIENKWFLLAPHDDYLVQ